MKAISGVQTVRFKNELVRNITIKLGYANAKVRYPFPNLPLRHKCDRFDLRCTNVKTLHALDQVAIDRIVQIKKTTHHVNGLVVVTA